VRIIDESCLERMILVEEAPLRWALWLFVIR
jgi:hypothetical protein